MNKIALISIGLFLAAALCFYLVFKNSKASTSNFNLPLAQKLGRIHFYDQALRRDLDSLRIAAGDSSNEFLTRLQELKVNDSLNRLVVTNILDSCGWLGSNEVGPDGSSALFLVIQHSDCQTMIKYLPLFNKAVKDGKAPAYNLALMEDRVLLCNGQKQKYGSQLTFDDKSGRYTLSPIDNLEIVDSLRIEKGLPPLAEYLARWGINLDSLKQELKTTNKKPLK